MKYRYYTVKVNDVCVDYMRQEDLLADDWEGYREPSKAPETKE